MVNYFGNNAMTSGLTFLKNKVSEIYGNLNISPTDPVITALPRFKFNFKIEMQIANTQTVFERVKSVVLPDINFDTQIVNQYNIRRVVQTRMNYGTCSIVFYDTLDNHFLNKVAIPYSKNYYHNGSGLEFLPNSDSANTTSYITQGSTGINDFNTSVGYTLTNGTTTNRYLIPKIIIQKVGPDRANSDANALKANESFYILTNCMITSISGDTLDYSDSQFIQHSVTFQPERVEITEDTINRSIS